jgi:predicted phage terminase large subunit-like protein
MKTVNCEQAFAATIRSDFRAFLERSFYELNPSAEFKANWHLDVLAYELEQVRLGNTKGLIMSMPPRSLKSHIASVAFPAYLLGHDASAQIICASYAQDLSNKFASECRILMRSQMYKRAFGTRLSSQRPALQELVTTRRGFRFATSVGGVFTGRGADYLIIDDPLKPEEAFSESARNGVNNWYDHTLQTRLNDQRSGRIIIIMQRLHEEDLVGHVLDKPGSEEWRVLRFPAIAYEDEIHSIVDPFGNRSTYTRKRGELLHPERLDQATLDRLATSMGSYNFSAQYLQSPTPLDGGMIKEKWFQTYTPDMTPHAWDWVLQSWDTANKVTELSDYSVCTTWGVSGDYFYLLDVFRKKMDYPSLKRAVIDQKQGWGASTVIIEDKASGTQLIQELIHDGHYGIARFTPAPGQDKVMRMHSCSSRIENGFLLLPENAEWLAEYLHELRAFPNGKHDDQVDSTSQALDWMRQRQLEIERKTAWVVPVRL